MLIVRHRSISRISRINTTPSFPSFLINVHDDFYSRYSRGLFRGYNRETEEIKTICSARGGRE
jgi:hypothetical protein